MSFNTVHISALNALTLKHTPFMDGPTADDKGNKSTQKLARFTYKNHRGQILSLQKRKYSWSDPTKKDKDGKVEGPILDAVLKNEALGAYNFEEYERNEFERMATAEEWPVDKVVQMVQKAPDKLEEELKVERKRSEGIAKKQADLDAKMSTVITHYSVLHNTYQNVRMEITSMALEVPALKGTPFDQPYFSALVPVVENMAKTYFPELVVDPQTPLPVAPKLTAVAAVASVVVATSTAKSVVAASKKR